MTAVFTFGEAMIRFSSPPGQPLETAPVFDVHVGGAEANVAASLARLGRLVFWVSAVPDNPLGRRVLGELRAAGVDCSAVNAVPDGRLGTYFVDLRADPLPARVTYDRKSSALSMFKPDDIPWDLVGRAEIVHLSGITPSLSPSCREVSHELARSAKASPSKLTVDVNYRSKLWSTSEASEVLSKLIQGADLVVCTSEDAVDLFATSAEAPEIARELSDRFEVFRVVITSGPDGAWWMEGESTGHVPAVPVTVVDRIGAGDAFMAGVLDGLIDDDLGEGVRRGAVLASLALSTNGDLPMVSRGELDLLLQASGRRIDR